jgi:anti-sigma regulatory factor (Ser/Thr protein kinase)
MARSPNPEIREFILREVSGNPASVAPMAARKFGLTRTGIARYMARLVADGLLTAQGNTRARRYELKPLVTFSKRLEIDGRWNEDTVWREQIRPLMEQANPYIQVKQNIIDLFQYGFTEMLNNVLDHAQSADVYISYTQDCSAITMQITDSGVGIFNKIKHDFKLEDARTALLELSKGKITSDKRNHSGEGIYFTSRMFDRFGIYSGHLNYIRQKRDGDDWIIESSDRDENQKGTFVTLSIGTNADWSPRDVFDKYQGEDIYFRKTHVPIALGRYPGEQLVSRSQAKRILARFPNFAEVILDFSGVPEIGQPFADEIFRVFRNEHPETLLVAANTNERIDRMIKYVQSGNDDETLPLPF